MFAYEALSILVAFAVQFGHYFQMKNSVHHNSKMSPMSIRNLLKVELHRHLDCSMRLSTMVDLAKELKVLPKSSFQDLQSELLVLEPMKDLASVLSKFLRAQKILASEEILTRLAFEACEDAFNDGIRVLEFRFAPTFISEGHNHLTPLKILRAFQKGIDLATKRFPMCVGLICIFQRTLPAEKNKEILHFILDHQQDFIAVDLADDESLHPPEKFKDLFQQIIQKNIPITIHAGESPGPLASNSVRRAVEFLGATRIGHGVQCIHDLELIQFLIQNKITLEVCPHSNYLTQAFPAYSDHPIRKLYDMGVQVTVNSDDPGIFHTQLSDDYMICHQHHSFGTTEFAKMNRVAFNASFISTEKKTEFADCFLNSIF
ncbi:MAG: adenosine deaminase [Pseudobdellovibrionaceae bacterium]